MAETIEVILNQSWQNISRNITSKESVDDMNFKISLKKVYDILVVCTLILIMLSMGSDIKLKQIWSHLKLPLGIIAGMICQFVFMPLLGFSLSQILSITGPRALGLLLLSCCPGGAASNLFAYFLDGDIPLSVTMTSISTLLALGFMPFNLWLYGHWVRTGDLVIPYRDMVISLAIVTGPALIGIFLKWKFPKFSTYVTKIGSVLGLLGIVLCTVVFLIIFPNIIFDIPWRLNVAVFVMPSTGFILGYGLSLIFRRNTAICKTVAVESSVQNVAIAMTILALSPFTYEEQGIVTMFPLMYGISMTSLGVGAGLVYQLWKRIRPTAEKEEIKKSPPGEQTRF